ncbi:MAG: RHS repeat domain-containing protein [Bacteroidota bacterium]
MDYAYTIQGWIKSVNGEEVDEATMMGADGNSDPLASTNINQHGARDAFGYSLSYFEDDYHSSNTAMLNHSKGANPNLAANIYNGNIGSMFTALSDENENAIGTHQTKYTYDQLNRIMSMQGFDRTVGAPESGSNYMAEYEYDENGNLTYLLRIAGSSGVIDKLSYVYDDPVNGGFNNRLTQVQDDEGQVLSVDLDDQSPNNYEYDEIGQLIKDDAEKISSINWTVNNKVDFIEYQPGEAIETIQFEYGAMGNRISKRVYSALSDSVITTYYILDAQGNSMSKYKLYENVGSNSANNLYLSERNIYGSSRVGMEKIGEIIASSDPGNIDINTDVAMITGDKFFEMSNHLGNVLQVVTDNKLPENDGNGFVDHYLADVVSYSDYYPGGMIMPGRSGNSNSYDYGFNGMEKDDEVKGSGNSYDFGARMYDPRVMRWLSRDPKSKKYPGLTPYNFVDNSPIYLIDPDGKEIIISKHMNPETGNQEVKISLNGVVSFDHFSTTVSEKSKDKYVNKLNKSLKEVYSKEFEGMSVTFESNMTLKTENNEIKEEDHVIYMVNLHTGDYKIDKDNVGGFVNQLGGKSAYFPKSRDKHAAAHEIGHWLGLGHPKDIAKIIDSNAEFADVIEGYGAFKGWTADKAFDEFSYDNIMHHPNDPGTKPGGGDNFDEVQVEMIMSVFELLNTGSNEFNMEDNSNSQNMKVLHDNARTLVEGSDE